MRKHFFLNGWVFFFIQQMVCAQISPDTVCILQLNDVYEIGPLNQGRNGGMARVATLVKQHEARYQTFVVLAGDFVSPSVIGSTRIAGHRVNGSHMIDLMNKAGVDLVTFGNHEFDIPENDLQQRINESQFAWVSSNVLHRYANGNAYPFYKTKPDSMAVPEYFLLASEHRQFTIGIVAATIHNNPEPWVQYNDNLASLKKAGKQARKHSAVVVALTHLKLEEDKMLLHKLKHISLVMGGHEHKNNYVNIGKRAIAKADANAKTMYRHLVFREGRRGKIKIISTLLQVDTTVVPDPLVADAVKVWEEKAYASFREIGLDPDAVVYRTPEPLDGTDSGMRYKQTNLGNLITRSMMAASPLANAAVFNSGSIRIDDMIEGVLTQLDIIRILPFGGNLCEVQMSGALLTQMLTTGYNLKNAGGYLQYSQNLGRDGAGWMLNGAAVDPLKNYIIASTEYLFSGAEKGLEFLKESNTGIKSIKCFDAPGDTRTDIRLAVVKYLMGQPSGVSGGKN